MFLTCLLVSALAQRIRMQDIPVDITQSLTVLLQEETQAQARLEHDLIELGNEMSKMKALQNNVTCGCPWHQKPVAFAASLSNDISSLGVRQHIIYDRVITNLGNGYDSRHGEFRAPVTGTYEFTVSMLMKAGQWSGVEIMKDSATIGKIRTGTGNDWSMAATSVTVYMNAGEDVWVQHIEEGDSNVIYGQTFSTFSGHLIQP